MKLLISIIFTCFLLSNCQERSSPNNNQHFVTTDIDHFWTAYDQIIQTKDSTQQYNHLTDLFLSKGSSGLAAIMQARRYTPKSYIDAINNYPKFWASIRSNTLKSKTLAQEIQIGIDQLKKLYPKLKPAKVYFTMGAFRTPGTTIDSLVLIGAELALGDENTESSEFPESFQYVKDYYHTNPINNIVFLNVHEFVHTQQKEHDYVLIFRSVYEGVAEFVAEKAMKAPSTSPAIAYGKTNDSAIKEQFKKDMYSSLAINNWLYNNKNNEFNTRDLGYYIGYVICENYYEKASDKSKAIQTMIDLDYNDETAFNAFVDQSGYFSAPISQLKKAYFENIPKITKISPFQNGDQNVPANTKRVTVEFSKKMDTRHRGFDYGPLGENYVLGVKKFIGFSPDGKSMTFEIDLKANKQYQVNLTSSFRSEDGVRLAPYLIDIKTAKQ